MSNPQDLASGTPGEDLSRFTVAELKDVLRHLKLTTTGSKAELINRINSVPPAAWSDVLRDSTRSSQDIEVTSNPASRREEDVMASPSLPSAEDTNARDSDDANGDSLLRRQYELMRQERDLLRRELRLAERERSAASNPSTSSIQANASTSSTQAHSSVGIRAIADQLSEYSGESDGFEKWRTQSELLREAYHLDEASTKALLIMRLKGRALSWFHSKAEHVRLELSAFYEAMEEMFHEKLSQSELRKEFEKRTWQPGETFSDYYHDKSILANRIAMEDEEFIDDTIDGVPDQRLRDQARMHRFKTRKDLLQGFKKLTLASSSKPEKGEKNSSYSRPDKKDNTTSKPANPSQRPVKDTTQPPNTASSERYLYSDNRMGRVARCRISIRELQSPRRNTIVSS